MLLQKLLSDRCDTTVIFYSNHMFCSCGQNYQDYSELENHLVVEHPRVSKVNIKTEEIHNIITDILLKLKSRLQAVEEVKEIVSEPKNVIKPINGCQKQSNFREIRPKPDGMVVEYPQPAKTTKVFSKISSTQPKLEIKGNGDWFSVEIPDKTQVVLTEDLQIRDGKLQETKCIECLKSFDHFRSLKDHYKENHPWLWCPKFKQENMVIRGKKPRGRIMGWSYRFYCPIPGCRHHILSRGEWKATRHFQHFPNYFQLKQHYLKCHVMKDIECKTCTQTFPSEAMRCRHEKTCGKTYICSESNCKLTFKDLPSLQTHCRRKNHIYADKDQVDVGNEPLLQPSFFISAPKVACPGQLNAAIALSELSNVGIASVLEQPRSPKRFRPDLEAGNGGIMLFADASTTTDRLPKTRDNKPPRLGEIEQFSTETQTDEFDALKLIGKVTTSCGPDEEDDDPFPPIDAETQLNFDDILCSNYTQTCPGI